MNTRALIAILISALCTLSMRALPFLLLGRNRRLPGWLERLGRALPSAIMAVLVVYCLRSVSFRRYSYGLPELIGIFISAGLHLWKRNILLSIAAGTITYMLLIRYVFV